MNALPDLARSRRTAVTVLVLGASLWTGAGWGGSTDRDHFRAYRVRSLPVGQRIALRGQFDEGFVGATLDSIVGYSNPVSKDGSPVPVSDAHLIWYRIHQAAAEPCRKVILKNQFGEQAWTIGAPVYLLVPSRRIASAAKSGAPPDSVDHYKCYRVLSYDPAPGGASASLKLKDAWNSDTGLAAKVPRLFAVPVQKRQGAVTTTILDGATHYAIYELSTRSPERQAIHARDPFGTWELAVQSSRGLMVPSEKLSWGAVVSPVGVDTMSLSPMD